MCITFLLDQMNIRSAPHSRWTWMAWWWMWSWGSYWSPNDPDGNEQLQYFVQGEPALRKLVLHKRWLKSLSYYTKFRFVIAIYRVNSLAAVGICCIYRQIGMLECFHSVMLTYCPKRIAFQWDMWYCVLLNTTSFCFGCESYKDSDAISCHRSQCPCQSLK